MQVSVVIAAYNSAARLICAVESVRAQDMQDFEIVVVGDAATDDSEARLTSLGDSRIRWDNMPTNWGEQSVPSNRGIELATGRYIFFLNQDDLWRPDHLSNSLALMSTDGADVVWSPYLVIPPGSRPDARTMPPADLGGLSPHYPRFDPTTFIPASCTGWRRDAIDLVQGWRNAGEVTVSPSQDLLWRAHRAGLKVVGTDRPTVLVLWSGQRKGSYQASYKPEDNQVWLSALTHAPWLVDQEMARASIARTVALSGKAPWHQLPRWTARKMLNGICRLLRIHPAAPLVALRYSKSGGFINTIRSKNDLEPRDFASRLEGSN